MAHHLVADWKKECEGVAEALNPLGDGDREAMGVAVNVIRRT